MVYTTYWFILDHVATIHGATLSDMDLRAVRGLGYINIMPRSSIMYAVSVIYTNCVDVPLACNTYVACSLCAVLVFTRVTYAA
jgi:hypothetical protein